MLYLLNKQLLHSFSSSRTLKISIADKHNLTKMVDFKIRTRRKTFVVDMFSWFLTQLLLSTAK